MVGQEKMKTRLGENGDAGALDIGAPGMRLGIGVTDPEYDAQSLLLEHTDQGLRSESCCTEGTHTQHP